MNFSLERLHDTIHILKSTVFNGAGKSNIEISNLIRRCYLETKNERSFINVHTQIYLKTNLINWLEDSKTVQQD